MGRKYILILVIAFFTGFGGSYIMQSRAQPASKQANQEPTPATPAQTQTPPSFNKQQYPLEPGSSLWAIVNKRRPFSPKTYQPSGLAVASVQYRAGIGPQENQLRPEAAEALQKLFAAAKKESITLNFQSGYRSHAFQEALYNRYVRELGQAAADIESARPGHSEHQTGLAVDVGGASKSSCNIEACFADTPEGQWLAKHAHKYGFIIRYPEGTTETTGYIYEPWHLRFVGRELASEMQRQKVDTMEAFFELPAAPDYP
ncbi:MAG TPA: M15 family metallopeptidase [Candidatus Limnocylindrales bacterium]|nr:M15 family metallopeptidase [Candidatus Limnocylindrales bacterium]